MANGFFVTEKWMKDNTPLCKNVDVKDIYPFINVAQDKYIKDLLGSKFFDSLKTKIIAKSYSASEKELLLLIRPCLAFYICVEALPFLGTKIRNKGILEAAGPDMQNADVNHVKYLRNECLRQAEYYLKRIQDYLCENGKNFTDYKSPDDPIWPTDRLGSSCDLAFDENTIEEIDLKFYKKYLK